MLVTCLLFVAIFLCSQVVLIVVVTWMGLLIPVCILDGKIKTIGSLCRLELVLKYLVIVIVIVHVLVLCRKHHSILIPRSRERLTIWLRKMRLHLMVNNNGLG